MVAAYRCNMTVRGNLKKFAEQAFRIERVLSEQRVAGPASSVVYLLTVAAKVTGISQKEVVAETPLNKDVVSKLVTSLVKAGLLIQVREDSHKQFKRLATTDAGMDLLSLLRVALQSPSPAVVDVGVAPGSFDFED